MKWAYLVKRYIKYALRTSYVHNPLRVRQLLAASRIYYWLHLSFHPRTRVLPGYASWQHQHPAPTCFSIPLMFHWTWTATRETTLIPLQIFPVRGEYARGARAIATPERPGKRISSLNLCRGTGIEKQTRESFTRNFAYRLGYPTKSEADVWIGIRSRRHASVSFYYRY